jgi:hypothetical protein
MSSLSSETNEFHNAFLVFEVDCSKSARNEQPSRGTLNSGLASGNSGLQVNLEIAQAVSQRRSRPPNRLFSQLKVR